MTCCIVGGGPAGVMLGYLLARQGVPVTVLEKHADFFRDFRGDTVHPSTLELFHELGLLEEFLKVPHQRVTRIGARVGDYSFAAADFTHLHTRCKFIALMPQWDFLNFLTDHALKLPSFRIHMKCEATGLLQDDKGRVSGVQAGGSDFHADLVVGCDGRHSTIRKAAGFEVIETGVPIDVLWFRLRREPGDAPTLLGNIDQGGGLVLIDRGDYYQTGFLILKNSFDEMRRGGIETLRARIVSIAPFLNDRVSDLTDWEQVKLLSVQINRLKRWHAPGLLCIGDAAHAMSPAGGVGINVAIQDSVAAANILAGPLLTDGLTETDLAAVQRRREPAVRITQFFQANAHRAMARAFSQTGPLKAPWQLKLLTRLPGLPRLLALAVGSGARPEHIISETQHP